MIQATGTIVMSDGITTYVNPLLNVYHYNPCKGKPQTLAAQVAVIKTIDVQTDQSVADIQGSQIEVTIEKQQVVYPIVDILRCEYTVNNPNFEDVQQYLKEQLEIKYPDVTFKTI
jgi:disulfide oxidoreductase YuzD